MSAPETASNLKFEIGHVLFIDIVGYSKRLINEQSEQIQRLRQVVRGTEQFHRLQFISFAGDTPAATETQSYADDNCSSDKSSAATWWDRSP